jgi:hypothetical protein
LITNVLQFEPPFCHHFATIQNLKKVFSAFHPICSDPPLFFDLEQHKPTGKQSRFGETNLCDNSMAVQLSTSFF